MLPIEGVLFPEEAHPLIRELIERVKSMGDCAVYPLPRMFRGRGELRIAHLGPVGQRKKARGVFVRIRPTQEGATFIRSRRLGPGNPRTLLSKKSLPRILAEIEQWRAAKSLPTKKFEKVEPNQPGTLQGGQFESNRRKH